VTLGNSGTAPVMLTGPVVNNIASASLNLGGNYLNSGSPNVFSGVIANGTSSLGVFVWRGAWLLNNDASTFTGSVRVGGGGVGAEGATLQFSSLEDIGVASALGSGTEMVLGSAGGYVNYFEYVGTREVSGNRLLKIVSEVNGSGANVILANGLGTLDLSGVVTNAMTPNAAGVQTRTLYLGGLGSGRFSGQGGLADIVSGGNTARIGISKVGSGSWTFSGGNFNYQGLTDILAGNLILDYTSYDQFAAATPGNVRPDGGTLTFKGKPAGTTSDTLPALQIGRGDTNYRSSAIVLDANGGDGFHLTVNQLAGDTKTQKFDLIDLSGSAGNSITVGALGTSLAAVNGVLMNNNNRSVLVVRTPTQYGFAALSGGTSGTVQPLSGQTALPTSGYANNVNYILNTANTVTPTAEVNFSTLTVDTTAGASTIALGTQNLAPNGSGRGLLFCGPNDATLSGTGQRITTSSTISIFFQNYLDGNATLNVSAGIASTGYIQWGGTGFTLYTGTGLGQVFNLNGGIFRVATAQTVNFSNGAFVIANGGVFEIGADLNGAAAGDFSYPLGGAPAGANKLCIFGSSGFSAAGANRVVNFGGASAALTWGNNGFLTYAESAADYGYTFKLSSVKADATLEIQNPINLNGNSSYGRRRTVEVANGSAAVDAKLSGALSGNAAFVKTGAGTLELTGAQTYAGPLMVMDGMLRVGADDIFSGSITVQLRGGGLAMGSGANALGGLELYANSVIDVGSGSTSLAFADSSASVWSGTLTINGSLGPTSLRFGTDANGLTSAQIALISSCGMPVFLDASGYLCPVPGTVLVVR
jgi:autotransporter-associated beta strand protein